MERNIITRDAVRRSGPGNAGPSGPVGPSGPAAATGYALDAVWPGYGTSLLSSYDASGFTEGTQVWVNSVGRFFRLAYNSFLPTSGVGDVSVLPASGVVNAQWIGITGQNNYWQAQTAWFFDPSNTTGAAWDAAVPYVIGNVVTYLGNTYVAILGGTNHLPSDATYWTLKHVANDENTGLTIDRPLLTYNEWLRRVGNNFNISAAPITWLVLSDALTTTPALDLGGIRCVFPGYLGIKGVTQHIYSGTVTAKADVPWTVTDSGASGTWTSRGCVSTVSGSRMIRKTTGNIRAWVRSDLGSNTCRITPPGNTQEVFIQPSNPALTPFTVADAYEIVSVPSFPKIYNASNAIVDALLLDIGAPSASSAYLGGLSNISLCGFRATSNSLLGYGNGGILLSSCIFRATTTNITQSVNPNLCSFIGAQGVRLDGDGNGLVNEFVGGQLRISHASMCRWGAVYLFDIAASAIQIDNYSVAEIDGVDGSGNSGLILNVRDPGCKIFLLNGPASVTATTSYAHPVGVVGVEYDYVDLPVVQVTKDAGIYG